MNYNEEAVDLTRKLVSVRQDIAGCYDVDASAVGLILAFGRRCAEDMRERSKQACADLADTFERNSKSMTREAQERQALVIEGANHCQQAIARLEVK